MSEERANVVDLAWPAGMLDQAMESIAERVVPLRRPTRLASATQGLGQASVLNLSRWLADASVRLGMTLEEKDRTIQSAAGFLSEGGPILVATPANPERRFFILLDVQDNGRSILLLARSRSVVRVRASDLDAVLAGAASASETVSRFCAQAGLDDGAASVARRVLHPRAERRALSVGFSFPPADTSFFSRFVEAGGLSLMFTTVFFYLFTFTLYLASWWLVGSAALEGHLSRGWLVAWSLMLLTFVICRGVAVWGAGRLAVHVGGLTRERLLGGILRLSTDTIRARGIGSLFGIVLDADALDALARTGGPTMVADLAQIVCGVIVLLLGAAPLAHGLLVLTWLVLSAVLVRRLYRRVRDWSDARLALTDDLVETMVGYRTMVAQVPPENRHLGEDRVVDNYGRKLAAMDRDMARLAVLLPRGWLALATAVLVPGFAANRVGGPAIAVSLGGIVFVYFAMRRIAVETGPGLATAWVAWQNTKPIANAAATPSLPTDGGRASHRNRRRQRWQTSLARRPRCQLSLPRSPGSRVARSGFRSVARGSDSGRGRLGFGQVDPGFSALRNSTTLGRAAAARRV